MPNNPSRSMDIDDKEYSDEHNVYVKARTQMNQDVQGTFAPKTEIETNTAVTQTMYNTQTAHPILRPGRPNKKIIAVVLLLVILLVLFFILKR